MARDSGHLEWGRLAAQRGDEDRQARERARQAREREKVLKQERADAGEQAAEEKTAELEQRVALLDEVLTSVLAFPPVSFARLMEVAKAPRFDPGSLGAASPVPDWNDFVPLRSRGLWSLLDAFGRYRRQVASARARFAAAQREHQEKEAERHRALAAAKARHDQQVTQSHVKVAARNAQIGGRRAAFAAREPEAVRWFVTRVLNLSRYPDGFPREYRITYDAENRGVMVEAELPRRDVVPSARAYRYVAERDSVEPLPRQEKEIQQQYERLTAGVTLRILHEVFSATPSDVIQTVTLDGRVTSVDPATGKRTRPRLLGVSVTRSVFEDLVLADVEPAACLAYLRQKATHPLVQQSIAQLS